MLDLIATRWATFWHLPFVSDASGTGRLGVGVQIFWLCLAIVNYVLFCLDIVQPLITLGWMSAAQFYFWLYRMSGVGPLARDRRRRCLPGGEPRAVARAHGLPLTSHYEVISCRCL